MDEPYEPYEPLVRIWINCMCFWYLEITGRKMSVEFQRTAPCASTPKCRWSKGRLRKQRPNVSWKPNKRLGHWPGIERDRGVESSCLGAMSIDSINLLLYRRENTHTQTHWRHSFLINFDLPIFASLSYECLTGLISVVILQRNAAFTRKLWSAPAG